jgi:molybdopterin synthase sulfur carrier subunit
MTVTVLYFASLREAAGIDSEVVATQATLAQLYDQLQARHGFKLGREKLRVAVDGAFADWQREVRDGAEVAFIPPVSGG